jgi:SAM-dependent methyltransferase
MIDAVQFRIDCFPMLDYQPLPWMGLAHARRSAGTEERWGAMETIISTVKARTAVDIGCNVGFFSGQMAKRGISTLGIEMDSRYFRIANYWRRRLEISNLGFLNMAVSVDTVALVPDADAILLLSVWHHWVRYFGLENATRLLSEIWRRCNKVLFFETGESEMPPRYRLPPMLPEPAEWLENYLHANCEGGEVRHLGKFKAFAPSDCPSTIVMRNLWAIIRASA